MTAPDTHNEQAPSARGVRHHETPLRVLFQDDSTGSSRPRDGADPASAADLVAALESGSVTLDELITARRMAQARFNDDAEERRRFIRLVPRAEHLFGQKHGGSIEDAYFSRHIAAAAVLAGDDNIHLRYPPEAVASLSPHFEDVIWRCMSLSRQDMSAMSPDDRRAALRVLHSLVVYLLGVLDAQHAPDPVNGQGAADRESRIEQAIDTANGQLGRAAAFIEQAGRRRSLRVYTLAMPLGVVVLALLGWILYMAPASQLDLGLTMGILTAGGFGAVVSVMVRISHGRLEVDPRAGLYAVGLSGAFRPVLGAVFGVAIYVVVMSGLLPVEVPAEAVTRAHFFYALAFLAGFSERLAQDVFTRAEQTILPPPADSASPPRPSPAPA